MVGKEIEGWLKERNIKMQKQERVEKIQKSRWNKYKEVRTLGLPKYLNKGRKEESMIRIARFRLGSEIRGSIEREREIRKEKEKKRCGLCGWKLESWEHVNVCIGEGKGGGRKEIIRILEDNRREKTWMKRLQIRRKMKEEKREKGEKERKADRTEI